MYVALRRSCAMQLYFTGGISLSADVLVSTFRNLFQPKRFVRKQYLMRQFDCFIKEALRFAATTFPVQQKSLRCSCKLLCARRTERTRPESTRRWSIYLVPSSLRIFVALCSTRQPMTAPKSLVTSNDSLMKTFMQTIRSTSSPPWTK